ncbi:3124_t:CDS:2, partial [Paraglomus occultum]
MHFGGGLLVRQNFAHYAPYTAAVEKEFFEAVRREVDKAEKFYVDILDILKTDFQDLILQSYRLKQRKSTTSSPSSLLTSPEPHYRPIASSLHCLIQTLNLLKYNYLPFSKLAIKKIFKKHDKIVGAVAVNQEMEALKYDVIDTITKKKAFWVKGEKSVGELLNEAE